MTTRQWLQLPNTDIWHAIHNEITKSHVHTHLKQEHIKSHADKKLDYKGLSFKQHCNALADELCDQYYLLGADTACSVLESHIPYAVRHNGTPITAQRLHWITNEIKFNRIKKHFRKHSNLWGNCDQIAWGVMKALNP